MTIPNFFICSSIGEYLCCFQFWIVMPNTSINIHLYLWVCVYLWPASMHIPTCVFKSLELIPQSDISGFHDKIFLWWKFCQWTKEFSGYLEGNLILYPIILNTFILGIFIFPHRSIFSILLLWSSIVMVYFPYAFKRC